MAAILDIKSERLVQTWIYYLSRRSTSYFTFIRHGFLEKTSKIDFQDDRHDANTGYQIATICKKVESNSGLDAPFQISFQFEKQFWRTTKIDFQDGCRDSHDGIESAPFVQIKSTGCLNV